MKGDNIVIDESKAPVRRAFDFLLNNLQSSKPFSKEEFKKHVNYQNPKNFKTYWSKKYKHLLSEDPNNRDKFFVSRSFRRYADWNKFYAYYSQSSKITAEYVENCYENLMIFEFFMPLNYESILRASLDELFYKDTIIALLTRIPLDQLQKHFKKDNEQSKERYLDNLCEWISDRFVGYSIGHVSGRFKADDLMTFSKVAEIQKREVVI